MAAVDALLSEVRRLLGARLEDCWLVGFGRVEGAEEVPVGAPAQRSARNLFVPM